MPELTYNPEYLPQVIGDLRHIADVKAEESVTHKELAEQLANAPESVQADVPFTVDDCYTRSELAAADAKVARDAITLLKQYDREDRTDDVIATLGMVMDFLDISVDNDELQAELERAAEQF